MYFAGCMEYINSEVMKEKESRLRHSEKGNPAENEPVRGSVTHGKKEKKSITHGEQDEDSGSVTHGENEGDDDHSESGDNPEEREGGL
jgi:hypothetical protein